MGNCFSDEKKHDDHPKGSNLQRKPGGKGKKGGKSGAGGARVEMSWAYVAKQTQAPKGADVKKYEQSKDPADYAAEHLKPDPENAAQVEEMKENNGYLTWIRLPGQINDQRINIENCRKVAFLLMDHCDSVQVDDCENCIFWIGPTTGSVFVRSCKNCKFVIACGQLRLRDVKHCQFSLFCQSRPVLETSSSVEFGPYTHTGYFELRNQFAKARLSVFNNKWTMVHDFTPKGKNFDFMTIADTEKLVPRLSSFRSSLAASHVTAEEEDIYAEDPVVPLTHGIQAHDLPHLFAVLFKPGQMTAAFELLALVDAASRAADHTTGSQEILLLNTLEQVMTKESVAAINAAGSGCGGSLKEEEEEYLVTGGPTIGICFAATSPDPDLWRSFLGTSTFEQSIAVSRTGPVSNVGPFAEAVFEKVPLMGMGFGASF